MRLSQTKQSEWRGLHHSIGTTKEQDDADVLLTYTVISPFNLFDIRPKFTVDVDS